MAKTKKLQIENDLEYKDGQEWAIQLDGQWYGLNEFDFESGAYYGAWKIKDLKTREPIDNKTYTLRPIFIGGWNWERDGCRADDDLLGYEVKEEK